MSQVPRWPALLQERRRSWLKSLWDEKPVEDQFQLRGKTVVVRLKPYHPTDLPRLTKHLDAFVDELDSVSRSLEPVSPANPVRIDSDAKPIPEPASLTGYAYLLGENVEAPTDDEGREDGTRVYWGR